jgi:tRNA pseudouridine38-40 synthase
MIRYNWFVPYALDVSRMRTVVPQFIGERDFQHFSVRNGKDSTQCTIHEIILTEQEPQLIIKIKGNRFLRKMMRGIVGFLHDIGRDRFSPDDAPSAFAGDIKDLYFAPPHGLVLMKVDY